MSGRRRLERLEKDEREVGAVDEADTRRRVRELQCTPLSEATAWKLLLNPKVHAYFTVMFKSQEPNLKKNPLTQKQLRGKDIQIKSQAGERVQETLAIAAPGATVNVKVRAAIIP